MYNGCSSSRASVSLSCRGVSGLGADPRQRSGGDVTWGSRDRSKGIEYRGRWAAHSPPAAGGQRASDCHKCFVRSYFRSRIKSYFLLSICVFLLKPPGNPFSPALFFLLSIPTSVEIKTGAGGGSRKQ